MGLFGGVHRVADLAAYEAANDPDKGQPSAEVDSNPYSVDASNPLSILVTDAGGNDLLSVSSWGRVETRAVFPFGETDAPPSLGLPPGTKIPVQPVPHRRRPRLIRTRLRRSAHGLPVPTRTANVFRVRRHRAPTVKAGGFTIVVDIARGRHGSLYVLQIASDSLVAGPHPGQTSAGRPGRNANRARRRATAGANGPRGVPPRRHLRRQQRRLRDRRADRAHPRQRLTPREPGGGLSGLQAASLLQRTRFAYAGY